MKTRYFLPLAAGFLIATSSARAQFAGEYADKQYLGGQGVFQMSIDGSGNNTQVWFSAVRHSGQGAAPEGQGMGKVSGNTLTFRFDDSCKNSGTGTITRNGEDIVVSMKLTHTASKDCAAFYGATMHLKHVKK
jgi:hypothetical protein